MCIQVIDPPHPNSRPPTLHTPNMPLSEKANHMGRWRSKALFQCRCSCIGIMHRASTGLVRVLRKLLNITYHAAME